MIAKLQRPIKCPNQQIPFTDPRIRYPMYASIKYDGFRGVVLNGHFMSPDMKPFGNLDLKKKFEPLFELAEKLGAVFDGEVWHPDITFSELSGRLRAHHGKLDGVEYHIFDVISQSEWNGPKYEPYQSRLALLNRLSDLLQPECRVVQQTLCLSGGVAEQRYSELLAAGAEGVILRSPLGLYKNNRCTHLESNMLKFKHFQTTDAIIISVQQRRKLRPDLERTTNTYGLLEKVHTQDSYVLDDAVGAFQVQLSDGKTTSVNLGRGFSYQDRRLLWEGRANLVGKAVEFKWMPHGSKDLPRIGSVVRFRPDKDL